MGLLVGGILESIGDDCYAAAADAAFEDRGAQIAGDQRREQAKKADEDNPAFGKTMTRGLTQGLSQTRHSIMQDEQSNLRMGLRSEHDQKPQQRAWPDKLTKPEDMSVETEDDSEYSR